MSTPSEPLPRITVLDGGLGTTLSLPPHNITFTPSTPLWSSHLLTSAPLLSVLSSVQTSFVSAGAEILLTDTYQASYEGFKRTPGWNDGRGEKEIEKCMRSAVSVSRDAFGKGGKEAGAKGGVALSLGPYGATMVPGQEYSGLYDEGMREVQDLQTWHRRRLQAFMIDDGVDDGDEKREREKCWTDVDLIAFETIPLLKEVTAVRKVMASLETSEVKPFWIACVFPGEANTLPDGTRIKDLVETMLLRRDGEAIPKDIGINCTKITKVEGLIKEFEGAIEDLVQRKEVDEWPGLVLYPDGTDGEVYNTSTMTWERKESESELAWDEILFDIVQRTQRRASWRSIIVGGCCKTTPDHISKLRSRFDNA